MRIKLISTLAGAALALGVLSQSDFAAAALGCKYQEAFNITQVGNSIQRQCTDSSAVGSVRLLSVGAAAKAYNISVSLLNINSFSARMRLLTAGGSTLGCDRLDQTADNVINTLKCSFPTATPATTFLFNAGDSVGH